MKINQVANRSLFPWLSNTIPSDSVLWRGICTALNTASDIKPIPVILNYSLNAFITTLHRENRQLSYYTRREYLDAPRSGILYLMWQVVNRGKISSQLMLRDSRYSYIQRKPGVFIQKTPPYPTTECLARSHAAAAWLSTPLAQQQGGIERGQLGSQQRRHPLRSRRSGNEAEKTTKKQTDSGWEGEKRKRTRKGRKGNPGTLNRWLGPLRCPISFRFVPALALLSSRLDNEPGNGIGSKSKESYFCIIVMVLSKCITSHHISATRAWTAESFQSPLYLFKAKSVSLPFAFPMQLRDYKRLWFSHNDIRKRHDCCRNLKRCPRSWESRQRRPRSVLSPLDRWYSQ